MAEKQRIVYAKAKKTTLEETRAIIKWLKGGKVDKKEKPDFLFSDDQIAALTN